MPNPYQAFLYPKAELGMILQGKAEKDKQGISTYVLKILLEHFKNEFIEKWSLKEYETYHKHLSLTIIEQNKLKAEKEKEKKAREKERIKMQKEALEIKRKEILIREQNLERRGEKQDVECERLFKIMANTQESISKDPKNELAKQKLNEVVSELREKGCINEKEKLR